MALTERPHPQMFETDEALARRLKTVEDRLADWEAAIPSLRREISEIRRLLEPCSQAS